MPGTVTGRLRWEVLGLKTNQCRRGQGGRGWVPGQNWLVLVNLKHLTLKMLFLWLKHSCCLFHQFWFPWQRSDLLLSRSAINAWEGSLGFCASLSGKIFLSGQNEELHLPDDRRERILKAHQRRNQGRWAHVWVLVIWLLRLGFPLHLTRIVGNLSNLREVRPTWK